MTQALCLNCGEIKFGAICPCPRCQMDSTGNMDLDIAFSDHNIPEETLKELGNFLKVIRASSDDDALSFWTFIYYISQKHPHILDITLPLGIAPKVFELYEKLPIPDIHIINPYTGE